MYSGSSQKCKASENGVIYKLQVSDELVGKFSACQIGAIYEVFTALVLVLSLDLFVVIKGNAVPIITHEVPFRRSRTQRKEIACLGAWFAAEFKFCFSPWYSGILPQASHSEPGINTNLCPVPSSCRTSILKGSQPLSSVWESLLAPVWPLSLANQYSWTFRYPSLESFSDPCSEKLRFSFALKGL